MYVRYSHWGRVCADDFAQPQDLEFYDRHTGNLLLWYLIVETLMYTCCLCAMFSWCKVTDDPTSRFFRNVEDEVKLCKQQNVKFNRHVRVNTS